MAGKEKCADCEYCKGYRGINATRSGFHCEHPDGGYIRDYFKANKISKMEGFIGYGERFADKPSIKTSPAWCPKKKKEGMPCGG